MFGSSTRVVETLRRLSSLSEPNRTNAVWVYNYLVCIDHLRLASWLVGIISGLVALIVAWAFTVTCLAIRPTVNVPLTMVVLMAWLGGCTWGGAYLVKKIKYQPRIDHCVAQLRQRPFPIFRQALDDIGQYDPNIVRMWRRLWGRPSFPPI